MTLNIYTDKEGLIGNTTVNDFTLNPGNNELPMSAIVNASLALSSVGAGGMVDLKIIGQTAVYNGVHLPYYVRHPIQPVNEVLTQWLVGESTQEPHAGSVAESDSHTSGSLIY